MWKMCRTKTLHAIFDGKVLKPEKWVDLEVGKRYVLTVEQIDVLLSTVCWIALLNQERELEDVLTSDKHFQQAGFRTLLREDIGSMGGKFELSGGQ